jgi:hypothetical protein
MCGDNNNNNTADRALRLDKIYVCKECSASFLFMSDMVEHHEATKHTGIFEMPFDQYIC